MTTRHRTLLGWICILGVSAAAAATAPWLHVMQGLEAETIRGDLVAAAAAFDAAAAASSGLERSRAQTHRARVALRSGDLKEAGRLLTLLATSPRDAELERDQGWMRKFREELQKEVRKPRPSVAPPQTADLQIDDRSLEEAVTALGKTFGVDVVADPSPVRVFLSLRRVTYIEALRALTFSVGLSARIFGGTTFIGRSSRLDTMLPGPGPQSVGGGDEVVAGTVPQAPPSVKSVTLKLRNVSAHEAVRRLVNETGVSITVPAGSAKVNLDLENVGLEGALWALADEMRAEVRQVGPLFLVGPLSLLDRYAPGMQTLSITLVRASAGAVYEDVQEYIRRERLAVARVVVDLEHNALVCEGARHSLDRLAAHVAVLDLRTSGVGLDVKLTDRAGSSVEESLPRRMNLLTGQAGLLLLELPSALEKAQGVRLQLMAEIVARREGPDAVRLDVNWRLTSLKAGAVQDVREGRSPPLVARQGQMISVPVWQVSVPGTGSTAATSSTSSTSTTSSGPGPALHRELVLSLLVTP